MTKKNFLKIFVAAMKIEDITHIAVKVMQPTGGYEVIIFGKDMFTTKYEYYKGAYDDEMRLKSFNKIYITEIDFSNDIGCLAKQMFGVY